MGSETNRLLNKRALSLEPVARSRRAIADARDRAVSAAPARHEDLPGEETIYVVAPRRLAEPRRGPTRREIDDAIRLIRESAFVRSERVQVWVDGVVLAAEQVQDKRLELLEAGKDEVDVTELLIDVAIVLTFKYPYAVPTLQMAAKTLFKLAGVFIWPTPLRGGATDRSRLLRDPNREWGDRVLRELSRGVDSRRAKDIRGWAAALSQSGPSLEKMAETAKGYAEKAYHAPQAKPRKPPNPLGSDTCAVALRGEMLNFASMLRAAIFRWHAELERAVDAGAMDAATLAKTLELLSWSALEHDLREMQSHFKMLYEALIWAMLYDFDKKRVAGFSTGVPLHTGIGTFSHPDYGKINDKIVDYWIARFPEQINIFRRKASVDRNFRTAAGHRSPRSWAASDFSTESRFEQMFSLREFFFSLTQAIAAVGPKALVLRAPAPPAPP